jgi:hypothetical protein
MMMIMMMMMVVTTAFEKIEFLKNKIVEEINHCVACDEKANSESKYN